MELYLLRHGKAAERSARWRPDSKRPLTREGEDGVRAVARGMKELKLSFDLILTSPYTRAAKTAQIVAEILKAKEVLLSENLAAEADGRAVIAEILDQYPKAERILLVGHEPFLSGLISVLLTGRDGLEVRLKKAGLVKVSVEDLRYGKCGVLEWVVTGKLLGK